MPRTDPLVVLHIVDQIKPLLAGKPPEITGAVMAELTSRWLAGNVVEGDPVATQSLRAELLAHHVRAVAGLVEVNAKLIGADLVASESRGSA